MLIENGYLILNLNNVDVEIICNLIDIKWLFGLEWDLFVYFLCDVSVVYIY